MKKKYLLRPGYVVSKNDGDLHYINYITLIRLYKVDPMECINITDPKIREIDIEKLIWLRPDYHGRYSLAEN